MDVNAVADELYGLPLADFTAARNAYVKQARQNGEKEAAAALQALGKPTAAAGLANQLVRRHRADLTPLLELGAGLRAAMASLSGAELRTLGQQQHRLISALVAQARSLAAADGHTVSADQTRGLEETLHAALADEGAAGELMKGRLTETLHRSGLGSGGSGGSDDQVPALRAVPPDRSARAGRATGNGKARDGAASVRKAGAAKVGAPAPAAAERERDRRERAEHAAQAERDSAAAELDRARSALDRAETDADEADAHSDRATATVARLRAELDRATAEQGEADRARRRRRAEAEQARRAARAAQRRFDGVT